jgi:hypothetical protein
LSPGKTTNNREALVFAENSGYSGRTRSQIGHGQI